MARNTVVLITITVDSKGRIIIPKMVRKQLGIKPGDKVTMRGEDGDEWLLILSIAKV